MVQSCRIRFTGGAAMSSIMTVPRVAVWVFPDETKLCQKNAKGAKRIGIANSASELTALLEEAEKAVCFAVQVRNGLWIQSDFDRIIFKQTAST